ncbi:hypothetical protein SAMN05421780_107156 [Flexibacter flexilis DSM 6793]|uniref:Rod shape-determining protein MreD n=1 Tax=Flexibacter flexilis DSM 6793 TaxID=927664 RepID=A0A1I1KPS5_9BACT|nr:hypothetical protein [Flexibacter flexilis]SFC62779.1 hypothetical protein SAMN05421780_107156 [Flexibacter flexilis DSM 6793]
MNSKTLISQVLYFVVLIGLQLMVMRNFALFGWAFCFSYVGAILLLPMATDSLVVMLIAFATGFVTDLFYNQLGINAAACVLVAFLRPTVLKMLTPAGGYESYMEVSIPSMGLRWYLLFMLPLLFVHHLALFLIEYATFAKFFTAVGKAFFSTMFTFVVVVLVQYLVYSPLGKRDGE